MTARRNLSDQERLAWLRLARSENVGPITFFKLLERYGDAESALTALPELARAGGRRRGVKVASAASARRELASLARLDARLIAYPEPEYPPALRTIPDPPPVLACQGYRQLLERSAVALVGSRNASLNGQRLTQQVAGDLAATGTTVISGLARGIDAAAHTGALTGGTCAVLAGGLDTTFPPENAELQSQLAELGVVLSEAPLGQQPSARLFPKRNRLIAGLSGAVVVVEAARKSGSLITARLAGEQGRATGAVPGSPMDGRCSGTNLLIKEGAALIENAQDILALLDQVGPPPMAEPEPTELGRAGAGQPGAGEDLAAARETLVTALSTSPVPVDALIRWCQLSPATVQHVLLELEVAGRVERHPGGKVALIEPAEA